MNKIDIIREHVGEELKQKRLSLGLTKTIVARKSGLTREQIGLIEKGGSNYTVNSFISYLFVLETWS